MKKRFVAIAALGLPIAAAIIILPTLRLGHLALSPVNCRLQRWNLPVLPKQPIPPIVPIGKALFPCCEGDNSCLDRQLLGERTQIADRTALVSAIDQSLLYLQTTAADAAYKRYRVQGVTKDRVIRSLLRFRELLLQVNSATQLNAAIAREFEFYQSVGNDKQGKVLFTAYFEPLYAATREPTPEFRYPIYALPPDLKTWTRPHPTRLELEGADGLQSSKGKLKGLELFWFRDRLEPYMIQIQGSARLKLPDGTQTTVGYGGNTAYNYKSIGKELIADGKLPSHGVTMPDILEYFQKYPQELNVYIPRDPSFVFFQENKGAPAQGSISVPLTADRSIATDKSLMPPGALALIRSAFPFPKQGGGMERRVVSRYVLDQDTGGAIKGPGRVDYFVGTGEIAGDRAGLTVSNGQLYYLLLKQKSNPLALK